MSGKRIASFFVMLSTGACPFTERHAPAYTAKLAVATIRMLVGTGRTSGARMRPSSTK
jgi:hypothetical protein